MKHYCIAGLRVAMESYGRTAAQASAYEVPVSCEPDITIHSDPKKLRESCPYLSADDCEYICTGGSFYTQLLLHNGIMLHSSCVVVDGRAYLFTAPSGTGKSTHTNLWLQNFGERAYILNDDKPALRLESGIWYAYGTPWSGKYDISRNERIPVAGIAVLNRGDDNKIVPYTGFHAITAVLDQMVRPAGEEYRARILETLDKLLSYVPVWKLTCNMDPAAATVAYRAMSGREEEIP